MHMPMVVLHICCATVGLLSGFMAMVFRKGSGLHGAAGTVFFVSMTGMSASGAFIAAFLKVNPMNIVAALLTLYLVMTGRRFAKHREIKRNAFDVAAFVFILAVGLAGLSFGFRVKGSMAPVCFIFGSAALLFAFSDVRMLRRGGVTGTKRLVRHLWRMTLALFIATFSFYPGQAKLFPASLRATNLLMIPHVLLIGSMVFWMVRMSRKRAGRGTPSGTTTLGPPAISVTMTRQSLSSSAMSISTPMGRRSISIEPR